MVSPVEARIEVRPESIALVGFDEGGPGQIHAWAEREVGLHVACFVHPDDVPPAVDVAVERSKRPVQKFDFPMDESFKGLPLISRADWVEALREVGIFRAHVLLADNGEKWRAINAAREAGIELVNIIHPTALVMDDAILDCNVTLHPKTFVGYRAELRAGASLNIGAQVDHHSIVGESASLDPAVITAGNVVIGDRTRVHTGVVIKNKVTVGRDAVCGAGAVVIEDVPDGATVVGVPARVVRKDGRRVDETGGVS